MYLVALYVFLFKFVTVENIGPTIRRPDMSEN